MSQKYEKLKTLLKELFQLDQPDLDFGLYRVMHAKSAEVSQFLDNDLLPQVKAAFGQYKTADKAELEKKLSKVIAGIEEAGMNPNDSPKVKDLRDRLESDAVDAGALESEVYDYLFSFFRRYYSEGDFLAKRVYKPGIYAIPYEGEEVMLHWANKDQYYIKTSEYLHDYAFHLRPDDGKKPLLRVHFGWWTPPRASTATSRLRRARTACSSWQRRENQAMISLPKKTESRARNSSSASSTARRRLPTGLRKNTPERRSPRSRRT